MIFLRIAMGTALMSIGLVDLFMKREAGFFEKLEATLVPHLPDSTLAELKRASALALAVTGMGICLSVYFAN